MENTDSEAQGNWKVLVAEDEAKGSRLDQWLAAELAPNYSRARIQGLIRDGAVFADNKAILETKHKVKAQTEYRIDLPPLEDPAPKSEDIALDILYEDDDILVINKPVGMVVHPGAGNNSGTLVNALLHHCGTDSLSNIGGLQRPGIVHRLDRETSGVMVVAKTNEAHRGLAESFADHGEDGALERSYVAVIWNVPTPTAGQIDAPLGRSSQDRTLRAVVPEDRGDARHAVTHYKVLEIYGGRDAELACLVECRLETGRTHQIRVHMAHIGHPVVGDPDYGRGFRTKVNLLPPSERAEVAKFGRQALHAKTLAFEHPITGETMTFETSPPDDMLELMAAFARL